MANVIQLIWTHLPQVITMLSSLLTAFASYRTTVKEKDDDKEPSKVTIVIILKK